MEYSTKTRDELISLCKGHGIKGYSGKKKAEIIALLPVAAAAEPEAQAAAQADPDEAQAQAQQPKANKKAKGQFYTTNSSYILGGLPGPPSTIRCIVEPFAGKGDLIDWVRQTGCTAQIEAYDIEPKQAGIQERDTLLNPPDYGDAWIITNPPYLARNKSDKKDIYDLYETNDLYKCFITSLTQQRRAAAGGIFIIPAGFFFSARDIDVRCRNEFMTKYRITHVKYFEETVFDDTTTTIVAFSFEKADNDLVEQHVKWVKLPANIEKIFHMTAANDWIIGGDIYNLPIPDGISVRRHVGGQTLRTNEQQTFITLNALDSGTKNGRISLTYKEDYIYPAKECSRTYATFRITGRHLSEEEQCVLCSQFNEFLEQKRTDTWSLFLPQFRESKEYARKRIPFELAYRILLHLIHLQTTS
jgi:hypothetical protein